jgi:queuine tRNA-ribosyltransferase
MSNKEFSFELITQDDKARLGKITTSKGIIDTPTFMPVGTQGSVKGIFTEDVLKTNTQIILGNTYHLLLRPGIEILNKFGGLHKFMNWNKPILTDSGGYQIMSLSKFNKIDLKMGAIFNSHIDGKKIILSPEKSIQVQKSINSDIIMVLDECPKLTSDKKVLSKAIETSTHWAERSKTEFGNNKAKALFGIAQGGLYKDLRIESIKF